MHGKSSCIKRMGKGSLWDPLFGYNTKQQENIWKQAYSHDAGCSCGQEKVLWVLTCWLWVSLICWLLLMETRMVIMWSMIKIDWTLDWGMGHRFRWPRTVTMFMGVLGIVVHVDCVDFTIWLFGDIGYGFVQVWVHQFSKLTPNSIQLALFSLQLLLGLFCNLCLVWPALLCSSTFRQQFSSLASATSQHLTSALSAVVYHFNSSIFFFSFFPPRQTLMSS